MNVLKWDPDLEKEAQRYSEPFTTFYFVYDFIKRQHYSEQFGEDKFIVNTKSVFLFRWAETCPSMVVRIWISNQNLFNDDTQNIMFT